MNTIKIWFADFWPEWKDEDFITPILKQHFNVILDDKNPDVVFISIFGNSHTKYKCKKILFVAENIRNDYNENIRKNINLAYNAANYTISFDPKTDNNYQLPLWQVFILKQPILKERLFNKNKLKIEDFKKFCSFTVSNGANMFRNSMFNTLSSYKPVSSYGRFLTNDTSLQDLSKGKYWRDAKDEFFALTPHKFSISFENTLYPYYCTEKLMDAFLAGSLPIYWGDPKVSQSFNPNAFINATKLGSSKAIELIKAMDENDEMFLSMYNQPVFTEDQKTQLEKNLTEFTLWLISKL